MKGEHRIILQNQRVHYDLTIKRNITLIRGDSATGKTTMIGMLALYERLGKSSGISLSSDKTIRVLAGMQWRDYLSSMHDSIVFIDEQDDFVTKQEFAEAIQDTDNYYVLINRDSLPNLPYSVEEVYGIRASGKFHELHKTYNEFYRIYHPGNAVEAHPVQRVICEDSNSGYQFMEDYFRKKQIICTSAGGKSNIYPKALHMQESMLIAADGAAFGPEMDRLQRLALVRKNIWFYLPESFEWILLASDILRDAEVRSILENPQDFIESQKFFSWERFFLQLLRRKTEGTYLQYSKQRLNSSYLQGSLRQRIEHFLQDGR